MKLYLIILCFTLVGNLSYAHTKDLNIQDTILVTDSLKIVSHDDLQLKTKNRLEPKISYLSNASIDAFIELNKNELPDLSDETIKANFEKIPTSINIKFTPQIARQIRSYLYDQRSFIVSMLTKSEYYFPMFEEELDKFNVPLELKYVSIIESHLNPIARSPVGASGLWQFMYTTAKYKGLKINSLEDERLNPIVSTKFAIQYFMDLFDIYNDWLLAIAAYNAGAGNVNKAIRACGGYSNFWMARPYMPKETQHYIPKIIAIMYVMHYAKEYLLFPRKPDLHYLETAGIPIYNKLSFKYAAELLELTEREIRNLNPSLTKGVIPFKEDAYILTIPSSAMYFYEQNKDKFSEDPYLKEKEYKIENIAIPDYGLKTGEYFTYTVSSGDNLGYIAEKYNCRVSDIKKWNGLTSSFLKVGKKLKISKRQNTNITRVNTQSKIGFSAQDIDIENCNCHQHEIIYGDNLWDIAQKYQSTIEAIKEVNNIPAHWNLKIGKYLKIPK